MATELQTGECFEKRRFINFLRGVAVFLMLWGHCIQYCCGGQIDHFQNWGFQFIYSFHMPLFMLISGYLFFASSQKRAAVELIEYKAKSLLYPLLMCAILNLFLTSGLKVLFKGASITLLLGGIRHSSLWFLWSVLSCSIAVAIAVKTFQSKVLQGVLLILCVALVAVFPSWKMNIYMYPYFVIGYLYARNEEKLKRIADVLAVLCAAAFVVMLFFFEEKHFIYTSGLLGGDTLRESVGIDLFRWAIGLCGSVTAIWICKFAYPAVSRWKAAAGAEALGRNSLAVYALSASMLSAWMSEISKKAAALLPGVDWNTFIWLYNLILTPCVAAVAAILLLLLIRLMKRSKAYHLIFGR